MKARDRELTKVGDVEEHWFQSVTFLTLNFGVLVLPGQSLCDDFTHALSACVLDIRQPHSQIPWKFACNSFQDIQRSSR